MHDMFANVAKAIDELYDLRQEASTLDLKMKGLRSLLIEANGGESELLIARVIPIRAHAKRVHISAHSQIQLRRKTA